MSVLMTSRLVLWQLRFSIRPKGYPLNAQFLLRQNRVYTKATKTIPVYFKSHDVLTEAHPGEDLLTVADRCGVNIPTGCLRGSCGTCEVEVNAMTNGMTTTNVVRACSAKVPENCEGIEIDEINDAIWGIDGMDI